MYQIYKKDSNDNIRVWSAHPFTDANGEKIGHYTVSGILGGKMVTTEPTFVEQKNVGKKNETSLVEQVDSELEALYTYQLYQGGYFKDIEMAKQGKKTFLEPMLAHKFDVSKVVFPVIEQPKLDGIRCIAKKDGLWTRQGKPIKGAPHVHEALQAVFEKHPDIALDGELYNHSLKDNFNEIVSIVRKAKPTEDDIETSEMTIQYHIYDVVDYGNLEQRTKKVFETINEIRVDDHFAAFALQFVPTKTVNSLEELNHQYATWIEFGYEGQMVRDPNAGYEHKRSKALLKRKEFLDGEFEIEELEEGTGNWAGAVKRVRIKLPDGTNQHVGIRGTYEANVKFFEEKDKYIGGQATVQYFEVTPDNKLRFGVATALYQGKRDL